MHAEVNLEERMTTTTTVDRKMIKLRQKRERKNGGQDKCQFLKFSSCGAEEAEAAAEAEACLQYCTMEGHSLDNKSSDSPTLYLSLSLPLSFSNTLTFNSCTISLSLSLSRYSCSLGRRSCMRIRTQCHKQIIA